MQLNGQKDGQVFILIALCSILFVLSGCAGVGPRSISMGRADYNEAINKTEDEQMLLAIVKERYGETSTLLAVSGIAANVRFRSTAAVELGFGPVENYAGRLKPFSGGLAYEENPTITYAPVQGEQYIRQLMSPIPLDILLMAIRNINFGDDLFTLLVNRVNDLRNPDFLYEPLPAVDPRFKRFVELFRELHQAGILYLVRNPQEEVEFDFVLSNYQPAYSKKVPEFLDLLDLSMPSDASEEIVIPAYFAINTRKIWGVGITTRSTLDLIEILRAAVEVPQEHARAGLDIKYPPMGLPGEGVRIISSKQRPESVSTAVKYEGYWFYTDKTDQHTKAVFRLVRTFWSISIAGSADQESAPVLTIPVSQ
ncbi:MAG: hypothetical protein BA865_16145 [Desulfobacterales bacterium S5133MH4]|nr:MAG: hypothetical protein BA865_16145 [Desulfobacterales bacterium S5133MH4]